MVVRNEGMRVRGLSSIRGQDVCEKRADALCVGVDNIRITASPV